MTLNSKSLIIRIHEILDGKWDGDEESIEAVASEYLRVCQQINGRIKQFTKLIREGAYYAALDVARIRPPLDTLVEQIRFPREKEWQNYLEKAGWETFEGFNDNELKRVKEICADSRTGQPPGYREYRKAILKKDRAAAIRALRTLYEEYPKDLNARQELIRMEKQAFQSIVDELGKKLKKGDENAIVQQVRSVKGQTWLIPFESEVWENCHQIYEAQLDREKFQQILNYISQLKVIQRVGDWRDGYRLVEKLKAAIKSPAFERLDKDQQDEAQELLKWYQQCEDRADKEHQNIQAFEEFEAKLDPAVLEQGLSTLNKGQIKLYQQQLETEWKEFSRKLPESVVRTRDRYRRAQTIVQRSLQEKSRKLRRLSVGWLILVPVVIMIGGGIYAIRSHETKLAANVFAAYEQERLPDTEAALSKWERFTRRFLSDYNPFRNYSAHHQVDKVETWVNEVHARHRKIVELLDKIELALDPTPNPSELRRVELNRTIVRDLVEKLPEMNIGPTLNRLERLSNRINTLHETQLQTLRSEIDQDLRALEDQIKSDFPENKSDFRHVQNEISEAHRAINALQLKFRQSFEESEIADLRARLDELIGRLNEFEKAHIDLSEHLADLQASISLNEYLGHLGHLVAVPLPSHPVLKAARPIHQRSEQFESLAQQLLLPNNPLAWEQFTDHADTPLVPQSADPKENRIFQQLAFIEPLKSIHRYRLDHYENGVKSDNLRYFYTLGEVEVRRDASQTQGRLIQQVEQFDETRIGRGLPFTSKVYTCRISASGLPLEGDILEHDRLTPESSYYRLIPELCGWDPESRQIQNPLLEVIDTIKGEPFVNPIFKAYLTQELFNIMIIRVFDWGLNFSPSAQLDYKRLSTIKGTLYPYDWLRNATRNRLLEPLTRYYEGLDQISYHKQAIASRELFQQVARQRIRYGGYVETDGSFHILKSTPDDRKLFGLKSNGEIGMLRDIPNSAGQQQTFPAMPFSPLLFFNDPPEAILERVSRKTGVNVQAESFRPFLPAIFL